MKNAVIFLALSLIVLARVRPAFAQDYPDQFSKALQMVQNQMTELKELVAKQQGIITSQGKEIETLRLKVESQAKTNSIPPSPAKLPNPEASKPRTLSENLKRYLLEKPESLPQEKLPMEVGMGSARLGMLLQEWYTFDDHAHDTFRHRRMEFGVSGKLTDHFNWKFQIDPALVREDNTTRSILKDVYFSFDGIPHHEVRLGQYKVPITEEGFRNSGLIDTIERSFIGRTFGDKRDIGLMTLGSWKYVDYQVGVFNGDELNRFDSNDQKDLAARLVLKPFPDSPFLKGFQGGTNMYFRTTNGSADDKKRIGAEARYEYGPLALKAEYMQGQDGIVPANGWYTQAGYRFLPRWETVFRFEGFDPNERISENKEYDTTIGLNYFLVHPTTKLQLNYVHKDAQRNGTTDNQIVGAVQYAF